MNILKEYTLDYVRHNKKSSVAIMIAVLISTVLLSALCGALYTFYTDEIRLLKEINGNWHAELFDNTPGDKLKYVTGHPNVEKVLIKGTWEIAAIDDPRRPYLAIRGFNQNYWNDMPEHTAVLEGRIPAAEDELAVSKQYFETHPDLKLGDRITFPVGGRVSAGKEMELIAPFQEGEQFVQQGEKTYTVVAKLDMATNSMTPYYIACGYLEDTHILPEDSLTVYIRFQNPRSTYEDINQIAQSVGFIANENGDYMVKVNNSLLSKYLIFSPDQRSDFNLWMFSQPLMILALACLVAGVFVYIIHNAFAVSANARLRQLGMLQSVGASPRQIRRSVVFEGLLLSLIPIPVGLFIGWALDYGLFTYINSTESLQDGSSAVVFTYGWPTALFAALLALLTVVLSALLPARKISRLAPIDSIRQSGNMNIAKIQKQGLYARIFGIEGALAQNALHARRKSYRTASISLTLSFLMLSVLLNLLAVNDARNQVYAFDFDKDLQDISVYLEDGNWTDANFENEIRSTEGVKKASFVSTTPAGLLVSPEMESEELQTLGGLKQIETLQKYSVYEDNGNFRIRTNLITLDDKSFANYCEELGIDATAFYDTDVFNTIVVNDTADDITSTPRERIRIPLLNLREGDLLNEEEKTYSEDTSVYSFQTRVGFVTDKMPVADSQYGAYQLTQIMPRSRYLKIVENFQDTRFIRAKRVSALVFATSEDKISSAANEIQKICSNWYGSGDYSTRSRLEKEQANTDARNLMKTVMLSVSCFLALIGISNVVATVSGNLQQRQKEFAMLRSVGISPKGVRRMLTLEALLFGIMPILLCIPLNVVIVALFLKINILYLHEFLPFLPIGPIAAFGAATLLAVLLAYMAGGRMLRKTSIVDILKNETL